MEPEVEEINEYRASFHDHVAELFRRVLYTNAGSLFFGLVGFLFSAKLALLMYATVDLGGLSNQTHPALTLTDRILLGAMVSLVAFHYLSLYQIYAYVFPGLYPHEQRTFLIPLVWAELAPIMSFGFLAIYSTVANRLGQPPLLALGSILPWLIRFYLITALSIFLLGLPRQKRTLTLSAFVGLCLLTWILPNHVFATFITLLILVCLGVSLVDSYVLAIWGDIDVETTIDEGYLRTLS